MEFARFYNNPENSDVTIIHKDGSLYAHQIILKANSSVLTKMLNSGMKETQTSEIKLTSFLGRNVETVIGYIYHIHNPQKILVKDISILDDLLNLVEFIDLAKFKEYISDLLTANYVTGQGFTYKDDTETYTPNYYETNSIINLILKYRLKQLYATVADFCRYNDDIIKNICLEDYNALRIELLSDVKLLRYDVIWCDHNDPKQIKRFICDVNWYIIDKKLLRYLIDSPTLTKYPYIYSLVKSHLPPELLQSQPQSAKKKLLPLYLE